MIVGRYITKEILLNFLAVTSILLFVAISNKFIKLLSAVAIGKLPGGLVLQVMALSIPDLLSSLMPLGIFISILFTYGRLHADSEMAVLFTSGVDWFYITKIAIQLALFIAICILVLTTWVCPKVAKDREKIIAQGEAVGIMQSIVPGQFQVLDSGSLVFYVEDINKKNDSQLEKVFIAEQQNGNVNKETSLITADYGYLEKKTDQDNKDFFLILKKGRRYTGVPGSMDYTVVDFFEYGRSIESTVEETTTIEDELMSTKELLYSDKLSSKAELQWRLSLSISAIVLGFLAVPLSRVRHRQGRFAKFLPAILIYIVYFNLIIVTRRWIAAGVLSPYIGIWVVHLMFFVLGLCLLAQASGRFSQWIRKYLFKWRK